MRVICVCNNRADLFYALNDICHLRKGLPETDRNVMYHALYSVKVVALETPHHPQYFGIPKPRETRAHG